MNRTLVLLTSVLVLALVPALAVRPGRADDGDIAVPTAADGELLLDGRPDERAWAAAPSLEVESVDVPDAASPGRRSVQPTVRVLAADDRLWIAVDLDEVPGTGMGVALMLAPAGTASAADALAIAFTPQSVRAPRWVVQGPRGAGRDSYRVEGAVDLARPARWSAEITVPFEDLALADPATPLRLAVAVRTRTPAVAAWAPPGSSFRGPDAWATLRPADPWPAGGVPTDAAALVAEDARDEERLYTWKAFTLAYRGSLVDLLAAAGHPGVGADREGIDLVIPALRSLLVEPLETVSTLRPDLAFTHVVRGGVLHQLGLDREAREAFATALEIVPGLREAEFGIELELVGPSLARGPVDDPTDFSAAFEAAEKARGAAGEGLAADGARFGTGLLHLAHGDYEEAVALFDPLAKRYPFQQSIVYAATRARRALETMPREDHYRGVEAERNDLPRVRLTTTKGDVLLELYEDDASNTVKNFVWLAKHGFYDGTLIDRTVPFLLARVGAKDPGWAIPSLRAPGRQGVGAADARRRRPFRGTVAMLAPAPDADASRFVLLTGTYPELDSDLIPFGRVLEGQAVVEALQGGDRLEKAAIVRTRPGTEYRPLTVKGEPAPVPR